jgi:NADPH:quinone reductase-like Zn-dependent oxidoreductase
MGYRVVAACGPHNFDLVKSYGADAVVDYHGADKASAEIKKITEGTISLGLDTISEGESARISVEAFGDKGGTLNMILPPSEDAKKIRSDVNLVSTLMYTFFGKVGCTVPVKPGSRRDTS